MGRLWLATVLGAVLAACQGGDPVDPCPAGTVHVCRTATDCRCGAACTTSATCAPVDAGVPVCAIPTGSTAGGCVDGRWLVGTTGSLQCGADPCGVDDACVNWGRGGTHCAPDCTTGADCTSGCCVALPASGTFAARNVCAPSRAYMCLGPAPVGACTNFDACVTVVDGARGTHCGDVESIEVRVRNDCTAPVDVELCYERIDGSCACGVHRSLAPGAVGDPVFWACAVTGRYRFSARAAGDVDTCHSHGCN